MHEWHTIPSTSGAISQTVFLEFQWAPSHLTEGVEPPLIRMRAPFIRMGTPSTRSAARWWRCSWRWGTRGQGSSCAPLGRHDAPLDELGGARRLNGERTGGLATILIRDLVFCGRLSSPPRAVTPTQRCLLSTCNVLYTSSMHCTHCTGAYSIHSRHTVRSSTTHMSN